MCSVRHSVLSTISVRDRLKEFNSPPVCLSVSWSAGPESFVPQTFNTSLSCLVRNISAPWAFIVHGNNLNLFLREEAGNGKRRNHKPETSAFFSCCFSCWKPNQLCSSWVLTWSVISLWGLNLSRLHEGLNPQAESSCGWCQTAPEQVISYLGGFLCPWCHERGSCLHCSDPSPRAQSGKSSVFGHRHDVTVRCDALHFSCSTLDPDHRCENYWEHPSKKTKIGLSSACSWPSRQPQHRYSYTETELFLSLSVKVQLLCAAGGWHQVSPISWCGTVWRHKNRAGEWGPWHTSLWGPSAHCGHLDSQPCCGAL